MRKQILPIAIMLLSFVASIGTASAQCNPDISITTPGLHQNNEYCFRQGAWVSSVWQLKVYDQITALGQTVNVDSIRIDSIINLPCGLQWTTNKQTQDTATTNRFNKLENGCFWIYGVTNDAVGTYNTDVYVLAYIHGLGAIPQHLSTIGSYARTRVLGGSDTVCRAADTTGFVTPSCVHPKYAYTNSNSGIGEISQNIGNLTNYPNPFGTTTTIMFTTSETQQVTFRVYDLVGKTMHEEQVVAAPGKNNLTYDRKGLTNGIYFYSISDGKHVVTSKMVIAE